MVISPRRSLFVSLYQAPGAPDPDRGDYGEEASQIMLVMSHASE